jgi:hypothetical protein
MQVLNLARDGTLIQHVPEHSRAGWGRSPRTHGVTMRPAAGSRGSPAASASTSTPSIIKGSSGWAGAWLRLRGPTTA